MTDSRQKTYTAKLGTLPPKPRCYARFDLEFVERSTNKVVWNGSVKQKLDTSNPKKSMERTANAVAKLLKQFPPKPK